MVEAWKASDLTAAQFAAQHGLKVKTLSTWQWRLKKKPKRASTAPPKLVQLSVADLLGSGDGQTDRWELTTTDGHRLRVLAPVAEAELKLLLETLARGRGRR
jgi:hypothetical protein